MVLSRWSPGNWEDCTMQADVKNRKRWRCQWWVEITDYFTFFSLERHAPLHQSTSFSFRFYHLSLLSSFPPFSLYTWPASLPSFFVFLSSSFYLLLSHFVCIYKAFFVRVLPPLLLLSLEKSINQSLNQSTNQSKKCIFLSGKSPFTLPQHTTKTCIQLNIRIDQCITLDTRIF